MITLNREPGSDYGETPLQQVAFRERLFPAERINALGTGVLPASRAYAGPLIGHIEPHPQLLPK